MYARSIILVSLFFAVLIAAFSCTGIKGDSPVKQKKVRIEIHHCVTCGFRSRAISLAEELNKEFGVESELVTGEVGSFDVFVNKELIFSKSEAGRFPDPGEVVQKIREYMKK